MLSVSTGHSMGYLTNAVGGGMDYYTGEAATGEPPGVWWGRGAESLGLVGTVDPNVIAAVSELHLDPSDEAFADPGTRHEARTLGRPPKRFRTPDEVVAARVEEYRRVYSDTPVPEQVRAWQQEAEASAAKAVHFYDMTFSPDKSVTVLYVTCVRAGYAARDRGDAAEAQRWEWRAGQVEEAVMAAGAAGLEYVADHAGYTRVGRHGGRGATGRWDDAHDLIGAQFLQHTSRDHDPQLHVHQPIINRVAGSDGAWRALDGRGLYTVRPAAGAVMERELEAQLTRRLGVAWEMREDGLGRRVVGVDPAVEDLFSSRRKAITARAEQMLSEYEAVTGQPANSLVRSRIMQQATLATRRSKDAEGLTWQESVAAWDARARTEVAGGLERQARVLDQAAVRPDAETFSRSAVIAQALENCHSDDGRATWTRHDLVQQIARALPDNLGDLPPGGFRALVEALADEAMVTGDVVQTSGRAVGTQVPDAARLANGQAATIDPSSVRHAIRGQVAAEVALLRSAGVRGRTCVSRADVEAWLSGLEAAAGAGSALLPAQRQALVGLACSDAALAVLVGPAGTGKSFTAGAFAAAWTDLAAGRVVGVATTQVAADVLSDDGVPHTANVAAFLAAQARLADGRPKPGDGEMPGDEQLRLGPRDVLVVDEASMVDTASLTQLQSVVEAAGARMVLMGDPRQLGPVGAGGMMRAAIDRDAETYTLGEVRRFTHDWERAASLRLRDGDPGAIGDYDAHGRILNAGTENQAVAAVAKAAAADRIDGRDVVVVTATNEHATAVAGEVRRHLVAAGLVEETGVLLGRDQSTAGVGDVVQARRIDRSLGLVNRETYRVTTVRDDGGFDVVSTRTGRELVMPAGYLATDVSLAYASTAHGAQGRTVDTGHVLLTGHLDRAGAYVGLTRGRDSNTAWAITETGAPDDPPATGRALLERTIGQNLATAGSTADAASEPDLSAVESLDADDARRSNAATLLGLIEDETRLACRERLDTDLDQLVTDGLLSAEDRARFGADQGSEHLARLLRAHEQAGHDPATALRTAIQDHRRSLADAVSVAQVVAARIDKASGLPAPDTAAAAVPLRIPADRANHLTELRDLLEERERELGTTLAADPPAWATNALGSVPNDPVERTEWERRAGVIAAHREAGAWDSEALPLGRCPGVAAPEKRANWHRAYTAAGMPDERRPEAEMSDGRLLTRVTAARRARAAAPADVYDAQRERHQAAEQARRDAILARAVGQVEEAARLEAAAADHAAAAEQLDMIAVTRAEHHVAHAETYTAGTAAEEELLRRGKSPGTEPDQATAEQHLEWIEAERAAREADDAHRVITETDLINHEQAAAAAERSDVGDTQERAATAPPEPVADRHSPTAEISANAAAAEIEAAAVHAAARRDELADIASQDAVEAGAAAAEDDDWHRQHTAAATIAHEASSAVADDLS